MAKKILKNRTQFTSTLKNELYEGLRDLSIKTNIPISKLLDMGVTNILKQFEQNK